MISPHSSTHPETLIRMANDIGSFFEAMPDRQKAIRDAADHINHYWESRMKSALLAYIKIAGSGELKEIMQLAVVDLDHEVASYHG